MIFLSSCPASWLLKRFAIAIRLFLCQLLPLCHLVKASDPSYGEQGLWWLTWPLCNLVGSSSAPEPPSSHCTPSIWGASALASVRPCFRPAQPRPARGHPRGACPSTPGAHTPASFALDPSPGRVLSAFQGVSGGSLYL